MVTLDMVRSMAIATATHQYMQSRPCFTTRRMFYAVLCILELWTGTGSVLV